MELEDSVHDIDGRIVKIRVRNFFCHDNLEINFNSNVNFIIGRNGSGKSALLTAIVVGLGGRASATNRGNSLKSFIKKGTNSTTIEITIKNSSSMAYKHELYGDYITVIRTITASGSSSYKIKSAAGAIVSTKFEEVNAITLAHNIQVDNPISILNQDDAKSFHAADAKKKYALFRKVTNLDATENNYKIARENCIKTVEIFERKKEQCKPLENEVKKLRQMLDRLQSRVEIEEKKKRLENEYYWSEIAMFERDAAEIQRRYDKLNSKIQAQVDKLQEMSQHLGNSNDAIEGLKRQLEEQEGKKRSLEREVRGAEAAVRDKRAAALGRNTSKDADRLAREERKLRDLQREIDNLDETEGQANRSRLEAAARAARQAAEAARARYDTQQHHVEQLRQHAATRTAALADHRARLRRHNDKLRQLRQEEREVSSRGSEALGVFGTQMVRLVDAVTRAASRGDFSQPPKGPIGAYIKVKDKKWASALEHIIGGQIKNFCVNNAEDTRKLFKIMDSVYGSGGGKPGVTCSAFLTRAHAVSASSTRAAPHSSALAALHVPDPVITNYLVDQLRLERVLLVPDHEEAMRLASQPEQAEVSFQRIVTLEHSEYYPAPDLRFYGGTPRPSRYLTVSTQERRKQLQAEIEQAEENLQKLEREGEELEQEEMNAKRQEQAESRTLRALLAERQDKERAESQATTTLSLHRQPKLDILVTEKASLEEIVQRLREKVEQEKQKDEQAAGELRQLEVAHDKLQEQLRTVARACNQLSEEIDREQLKQEQGASSRQSHERRLHEDRKRLADLTTILTKKNDEIQAKIQGALQLCPRIDNPRSPEEVQKELKSTKQKLHEIRVEGMSRAELTELVLAAETRHRALRAHLAALQPAIALMKELSHDRLKYCYKLQNKISELVQQKFLLILTLRGYSGHMKIEHDAGTLELVCGGRDASGARAGSSASLSGGERSYATVAFIIALWGCVQLPFHFMDEFDVFMDNVNRRIVMNLLKDHAKDVKHRHKQFVFLTPHQISSITAGEHVSIHVMADPRS